MDRDRRASVPPRAQRADAGNRPSFRLQRCRYRGARTGDGTVVCGRYASFLPAEALRAMFQTVNPTPNWEPTWNMAPTRYAPVVRLHPGTRAPHFYLLRWGLVPHWAKDPKSVRQPINARAETLATAPMFRDALARRRCLVPAD